MWRELIGPTQAPYAMLPNGMSEGEANNMQAISAVTCSVNNNNNGSKISRRTACIFNHVIISYVAKLSIWRV